MTFQLRIESDVEREVKRVAEEQVAHAIDEIHDASLGDDKTVHEVRKHCKKIRGLLRLVRKNLGGRYARENAFFRDLARSLSGARDARVLVATFDSVFVPPEQKPEFDAVPEIRRALSERHRARVEAGGAVAEELAAARHALEDALTRIAQWRIDASGFDAFLPGLIKTYGRGRRAMARAFRTRSETDFHQWRKRVKYHWYHMRLLSGVWQPLMEARAESVGELADLLGRHHDLAVLRRTLSEESADLGLNEDALRRMTSRIEASKREIEGAAGRLGHLVYAEPPKALARRLERYWDTEVSS